jgi:hypothetical protein
VASVHGSPGAIKPVGRRAPAFVRKAPPTDRELGGFGKLSGFSSTSRIATVEISVSADGEERKHRPQLVDRLTGLLVMLQKKGSNFVH